MLKKKKPFDILHLVQYFQLKDFWFFYKLFFYIYSNLKIKKKRIFDSWITNHFITFAFWKYILCRMRFTFIWINWISMFCYNNRSINRSIILYIFWNWKFDEFCISTIFCPIPYVIASISKWGFLNASYVYISSSFINMCVSNKFPFAKKFSGV